MSWRFWRKKGKEDVATVSAQGEKHLVDIRYEDALDKEAEKDWIRAGMISEHIVAIRRLSIDDQVSISVNVLASLINKIRSDNRSDFLLEVDTKVLCLIREARIAGDDLEKTVVTINIINDLGFYESGDRP